MWGSGGGGVIAPLSTQWWRSFKTLVPLSLFSSLPPSSPPCSPIAPPPPCHPLSLSLPRKTFTDSAPRYCTVARPRAPAGLSRPVSLPARGPPCCLLGGAGRMRTTATNTSLQDGRRSSSSSRLEGPSPAHSTLTSRTVDC